MKIIAVCGFGVLSCLLVVAGCSDSDTGGGAGGATGAAGAGGGGQTTTAGSCRAGKDSCSPGTAFCCDDYHGSFSASSVQTLCSNSQVAGTYSASPCPSADREATCTLYAGTAAEKVISYYTGYDELSGSDPETNCNALHGSYAAE